MFCFPVGLVLLWTSPKATKPAKIAGTVVIGIFVLSVMSSKKSEHSTSSAQSSPAGRSAPAKAAEAQISNVTESCVQLATNFGTDSKLSDLQKEEMWKQYAGKGFQWDLEITEVSSGTFGGFHVQAKCAPKSPSLIQDIQIAYDDDAKGFVMTLQKGKSTNSRASSIAARHCWG